MDQISCRARMVKGTSNLECNVVRELILPFKLLTLWEYMEKPFIILLFWSIELHSLGSRYLQSNSSRLGTSASSMNRSERLSKLSMAMSPDSSKRILCPIPAAY